MIIEIGDFLVSSEIITECFSCDYEVCRGCCCIVGDSGAPIALSESEKLKENFESYKHRLEPAGLHAIEEQSFSIIDPDNERVTPLVSEGGKCAYAITDENGYTLCAVQKMKPLSCLLYPIRVSKLSNGLTALNLSREHLCTCAFKKGEKEGVHVYEFLQEALTYAFGKKFYDSLVSAALLLLSSR